MLQDMVAHSSAAFRASAASTTHMASSASATLNAGLDALTSSQQDICLKVGQNADTLDLHLTQTGGAFTTQMQGVSTASQGADAVLSTVSGEVGAKRKFLDHTVGELAVEVGGAIETALGVVDSTSLTASQVLTDVSAASRAMQATASTSTDAFAAYMDCEGDLLCATLNTHFSALGGHVLTHIEGLGEMEESAQRHDWVISESAVPVTGSTPQKLSLTASQSPFKRTRAHREIKTAARGVGGVGYEEASRGIAEAGGAPGADEEEGEIEGEGQMEEEMVGEEMEASEEVEGGAEMAEEGEEEGRAISRFSEESASSASSKACKDPTAPTAPTSAPEEAQDENSPVSPNVPKKRRTTKIAGPSTRPSRSQSANLDI
ncbi:hypothetical protein B484DRAFT_399840 [Ochromonadaceae sp. CCMP2298]|nr:hypothetical protein B484DRAFT_399840 [Ochromonadaceae sp. CCMP2298]